MKQLMGKSPSSKEYEQVASRINGLLRKKFKGKQNINVVVDKGAPEYMSFDVKVPESSDLMLSFSYDPKIGYSVWYKWVGDSKSHTIVGIEEKFLINQLVRILEIEFGKKEEEDEHIGMRKLLELIESRSKLDTSKPWTMSASQWLAANNIHQPWIGEISPMQYAHMSQRAKNEYDKKRNMEWEAASKGKEDWAKAVKKAFEAGRFDKNDADVDPEAKSELLRGMIADDKAAKEAIFKEAEKKNRLETTADAKIGDRVFHSIYRNYYTVKKAGKASFTLVDDNGREIKGVKPGYLDWLNNADLKASVGQA